MIKHYYFFQLILPQGIFEYGILSSEYKFSPYYQGWLEIRRQVIAQLNFSENDPISLINAFYLYSSELSDSEIKESESSSGTTNFDLPDINSELDCLVFSYGINSANGGILSGVFLVTYRIYTTRKLKDMIAGYCKKYDMPSSGHKLLTFALLYSGNVGELQKMSNNQKQIIESRNNLETLETPSIYLT